MLFYTFGSQRERQEFGNSYFIEIQYCEMGPGENIEKLVSPDAIKHWKADSLYIHGDDDNRFYRYYSKIFNNGVYANRKTGPVDLCGINYYPPDRTRDILNALKKEGLPEQEKLVKWLKKAADNNGFYILGL